MGTIHKTVTAAVAAANQANSAASTGPVTESGKEQSRMNAFKSGKYARRPDPVELLLKDHTEEENAEREELRAEMVRCCQPPDDFARLQTEEMADLRFELRRLERVQEVILARERELLALEQRRRAFHGKQESVVAPSKEIVARGLVGQPDSPGKLREMLRVLESLVEQDWELNDARVLVERLYGNAERNWRGVRIRWALNRAQKAENDEERQRATQDCEREVKQEIERVREELEISDLEQGPLSQVAEAARLLEAMNSRKWSWVRQREMFLRRSIDRKVQVLIELRREANRAERRTAEKGEDKAAPGQQGPSQGSGQAPSGEEPPPTPGGSHNTSPEERDSAPNPGEHGARNVAPEVEAALRRHSNGGLNPPLREGLNQGTKPLSALISAGASCASRMVRANPASGSISKDVPWEAHSVNENRRCSSKRC